MARTPTIPDFVFKEAGTTPGSTPMIGRLYFFLKKSIRLVVTVLQAIIIVLDFLEISDIRKTLAGTLSYGLRKRVELARAIAINPNLILLDEPMAGMNQEEKEDMARFIIDLNREWKITVVMIEHDMGVVMDISKRIAVLDFGEKIAEGTPDEVIKNKRVQQAYLGDES